MKTIERITTRNDDSLRPEATTTPAWLSGIQSCFTGAGLGTFPLCVSLIVAGTTDVSAISGEDGSIWVSPGNIGSPTIPEGNANNTFPFIWSQTPSQRYQQVYAGSAFHDVTGPVFITQIAFRRDALSFASEMSLTIPNIQINLSTTDGAPDALSPIFTDNIGLDETVVHSGSLSISSAASVKGLTREFDLVISLQTPFPYDPTSGNLLMDVRRWSPTPGDAIGHSLDAQNSFGDSMSRVYTDNALDLTSQAGYADSFGLLTRFGVSAVPEPSTAALAGLGAVGLLLWRRRK